MSDFAKDFYKPSTNAVPGGFAPPPPPAAAANNNPNSGRAELYERLRQQKTMFDGQSKQRLDERQQEQQQHQRYEDEAEGDEESKRNQDYKPTIN